MDDKQKVQDKLKDAEDQLDELFRENQDKLKQSQRQDNDLSTLLKELQNAKQKLKDLEDQIAKKDDNILQLGQLLGIEEQKNNTLS